MFFYDKSKTKHRRLNSNVKTSMVFYHRLILGTSRSIDHAGSTQPSIDSIDNYDNTNNYDCPLSVA